VGGVELPLPRVRLPERRRGAGGDAPPVRVQCLWGKGGAAVANPVAYELSHRDDPPQVGLVVMLPDFGLEGEPPVSQDWYEEVKWRLQEIDQLISKVQADRCPWESDVPTYQQSMAVICDVDTGPVRDYVREIASLIPPPK
jgi:hypothetical protein